MISYIIVAIVKIPKKSKLRGEDGYKIFSVRIRNETANALDSIQRKKKFLGK